MMALSLIGCSTTSVSTKSGAETSSTDISEINFGGSSNFRVGVLLPLSGDDLKKQRTEKFLKIGRNLDEHNRK